MEDSNKLLIVILSIFLVFGLFRTSTLVNLNKILHSHQPVSSNSENFTVGENMQMYINSVLVNPPAKPGPGQLNVLTIPIDASIITLDDNSFVKLTAIDIPSTSNTQTNSIYTFTINSINNQKIVANVNRTDTSTHNASITTPFILQYLIINQ